MNSIVVTSTKQNIKFGYEGEDNVTKIIFPYDESWLEYGEGNFEVRILRCGDEVAYTATEVVDDRQAMTLTMTVTDIELSVRGRGEMQLCYVCPDSIKKSPIYQYTVNRSIDYKYAVDPPDGSIIASVEKSLSEIKNTTNRLSNSVISIENSINDVNSQINNINNKISEFDDEIDSIGEVETGVDNLETSIQSINGRINTAEGNINENTESISDLNESVTELENRKVTDLETSGGKSDSGKYLTVGTDGKIKATSLTIPPTITVDDSLSTTSKNPVQNKVIKTELNNINSNIETCNTEISKINGSLGNLIEMVLQDATASDFNWTFGKNISGSGTTSSSAGVALSELIHLEGIVDMTDGHGMDGINTFMHVHEYSSEGIWLRRIPIYPQQTYRCSADCSSIRIAYGYSISTGITITRDILEQYFKVKLITSAAHMRDLAKNNRDTDAIWINNTAVKSSDGTSSSSTTLKLSNYIEVGKNVVKLQIRTPVFANNTTFGIAFYDDSFTYISGTGFPVSDSGVYDSIVMTHIVPTNAKYFRTCWYMDEQTYGSWMCNKITSTQSYIYVCAADSSDGDKWNADYICSGINDEYTIKRALQRASYREINMVRFAKGTYKIGSFPFNDGSGIKYAIPVGTAGSSPKETLINIIGDGYGSFRKQGTLSDMHSGVKFEVTSECYESLDNNVQYAIFACVSNNGARYYPGTKANFEHLLFEIPDNQKKIICVDGWYMSALSFDDIHLNAVAYKGTSSGSAIPASELHIGVDGCIGVRGLQGSCYGVCNIWKNSFAWGFGTGFHVVGEHIIAESLGTRFCTHGYIFGATTDTWTLSLSHPNTLINCCDECNFNLPIFGKSGRSNLTDCRQNVTLIDYNLECRQDYFALGGDRAKEIVEGAAFGSITFTDVDTQAHPGVNKVDFKFWEDGYGTNVKTINGAHSDNGTSAERLRYLPTYMQQYYDTDLNKLLIYDGTNWRDVSGAVI